MLAYHVDTSHSYKLIRVEGYLTCIIGIRPGSLHLSSGQCTVRAPLTKFHITHTLHIGMLILVDIARVTAAA